MAKKPFTPTPRNPNAYPPKGYAAVHRVADGDNWWTLQKQYGLTDVWDLIRFNFGTADPNEVNWFLANKVGCTKTTPDGKNYCFSSAAKPGLIYVPAVWGGKGGGYGEGGSDADRPDATSPLSDDDKAAKQVVLQTLRDGSVNHVRFTLPTGYFMTPDKIRKVIGRVEADAIKVRYKPNDSDHAWYFERGATGVMHVPFKDRADGRAMGLVLHECIHAAMDVDRAAVLNQHSEAAAYIGQFMFLIWAEGTKYRKTCNERKLLNAAWLVAHELTFRAGPKVADNKWDHVVRDFYYDVLLAHIMNDRDYKKHNDQSAGYDGVGEPAPPPGP